MATVITGIQGVTGGSGGSGSGSGGTILRFSLEFYALDIDTFKPIEGIKVYKDLSDPENPDIVATSDEKGLIKVTLNSTSMDTVNLTMTDGTYPSRQYKFTFGSANNIRPRVMLFRKLDTSPIADSVSKPTLLDWLGRTINDKSFYIQYESTILNPGGGSTTNLSEEILFTNDGTYSFEYPTSNSQVFGYYLNYRLEDGRSGSKSLPIRVGDHTGLSKLTFTTDLQREYYNNMSQVPSLNDLRELLKDDRFI